MKLWKTILRVLGLCRHRWCYFGMNLRICARCEAEQLFNGLDGWRRP